MYHLIMMITIFHLIINDDDLMLHGSPDNVDDLRLGRAGTTANGDVLHRATIS
jgi:hypothetical protein